MEFANEAKEKTTILGGPPILGPAVNSELARLGSSFAMKEIRQMEETNGAS